MNIAIPAMHSPDSCFEALWLSCVERIGRGSNRDVYNIPGSGKVLKVSNRPCNFTNWAEIIAYHYKKDTGQLAEIFSWSWSGKFIVMEKLAPLAPGSLHSFDYPDYLTDRKPENFGRDAAGNIKALDYAMLKCPKGSVSQFA